VPQALEGETERARGIDLRLALVDQHRRVQGDGLVHGGESADVVARRVDAGAAVALVGGMDDLLVNSSTRSFCSTCAGTHGSMLAGR